MWQIVVGIIAICITIYGIAEEFFSYLKEKAKYENKDERGEKYE